MQKASSAQHDTLEMYLVTSGECVQKVACRDKYETSLRSIQELGRGLSGKVLAVQAQGPEFNPHNPC